MQADRSADLITIGIDIGGSKTKIGLFKRGGQMVAKHVIPTGTKETGGVLQAIADKMHEVIERSPFGPADIGGIGLGVPGTVAKGGVVVECANIDMKEVYPPEEFKRIMPELEVPVRVCNNANAAALGELWRGGASKHNSVVMVTIGTAIGGGVVLDGKIVEGAFYGLRPASIAMITAAGLNVAKVALVNPAAYAASGNLGDLFLPKASVLAIAIFLAQRKLKWSPVVFIGISAVVGVVLQF